MRHNSQFIFISLVALTLLPFCAAPMEEVRPVFAPTPGGYSASSIDQECRDILLKSLSKEIAENLAKKMEKGKPLILVEGLKAPRTQEILDYIYRVMRKKGIFTAKEAYVGEKVMNNAILMIVYPVVDGVDFIPTLDKKSYNRQCKMILHVRAIEGNSGKILWVQDFSQLRVIELGLEKGGQ